jgi:hypothetical protein
VLGAIEDSRYLEMSELLIIQFYVGNQDLIREIRLTTLSDVSPLPKRKPQFLKRDVLIGGVPTSNVNKAYAPT